MILQLYISGNTDPRKVAFYRFKLLRYNIRKRKNQYFRVISKFIMASQKQRNCWQNFFTSLNAYQPKTELIKVLNFLDSSRLYGIQPENLKTGGSGELFLPENDFKTCSTVNFPKNYPDYFGSLETNQRHEIQT